MYLWVRAAAVVSTGQQATCETIWAAASSIRTRHWTDCRGYRSTERETCSLVISTVSSAYRWILDGILQVDLRPDKFEGGTPHLNYSPSFWQAVSPSWGRTPERQTNIVSEQYHTLYPRGNSGVCPHNIPPAERRRRFQAVSNTLQSRTLYGFLQVMKSTDARLEYCQWRWIQTNHKQT